MDNKFGIYTPLTDDPRFAARNEAQPAKRKPGPMRLSDPNPQIARFGPGPVGATCADCVHLLRYHQVARWNKCALRKIDPLKDGGSTDQKAGWPACAKYQSDTE
jgi:hypothetical protein